MSVAKLTQREREIADLLSRGVEARQVAEQLRITLKTVMTHRERIFRKLGVHNSAAMTRKIVEWEAAEAKLVDALEARKRMGTSFAMTTVGKYLASVLAVVDGKQRLHGPIWVDRS